MRRIAAVLLCACYALAEPPVADFETPDSTNAWATDGGEAVRVEGPVHAGTGALRWKSAKDGARLSFDGLRGDLTPSRSIRFFAWLEGTIERDLVLRLRSKGGEFWRKFSLRPQVWSEIIIPFYQFREDGLPRWNKIEGLEIVARRAVTLVLDDLSLVPGGTQTAIEPASNLIERVFAGADSTLAMTDNFRVFTDAPVDTEAVTARLEEGLARFRKMYGAEGPLAFPVTLIIRKTPEDYRRTAVDTARDIYGGDLSAPQAGGFTFYGYSFTSYDEKYGNLRPVFIHECGHQLVSRLLGFRGPNGATWLEEGLCYSLQNEFAPIENGRAEALKLLDNAKRPGLETLHGKQKIDSGAENLTGFLVVQFLLKGPHADKWKDLLAALHENDVDLLKSAEEVYGMKAADFVKEYEEFTRKWAEEK